MAEPFPVQKISSSGFIERVFGSDSSLGKLRVVFGLVCNELRLQIRILRLQASNAVLRYRLRRLERRNCAMFGEPSNDPLRSQSANNGCDRGHCGDE